jgi:16S rRNA (cytosine1402-N4)-methyltransferase
LTRITHHKPVLLKEVLDAFDYLKDKTELVFVDGTIGLAGHSTALALKIKNQKSLPRRQAGKIKIIGIDKDQKALDSAKLKAESCNLEAIFTFVHDDFSNYEDIIHSMNLSTSLEASKIDGILLDLGVSSMQLDERERGFSFQDPEQPLDMRMNQKQIITAAEILNTYPLIELRRVLKYAEEKYHRHIAENICLARKVRKIRTVGDLLKILEDSIPAGVRTRSKKHFATNTFRGLRIETNNELSHLADTIKTMTQSLKVGGKIAIISFHSTEDRIVKHTFKELANPCTCPREFPQCVCGKKPEIKILTTKPIEASEQELGDNPRARSAKLRIAERI